MKEALGGISLFQIVVLFILLFTGIMCMTINHAKAFGVKDEIVTIIQNSEIAAYGSGSNYELDATTSKQISDHLRDAGYRITGTCPSSEWIGYDREGKKVAKDAAYCIKINDVSSAFHADLNDKCKNDKCVVTNDDFPSMVYYDVVVFYQLDIPVFKQIMNFKIYSSTKVLFG
ncbi:MAG: hypothetical protein IJY87_04060 [Bacilli bacterium]|nr:hypothetical protein [Bacilli bacterium]